MRKILFFLLFAINSIKSSPQIVINTGFGGVQITSTDASAFGVTGATFTAGRLYLFIGMTTGTTNNGTLTTTSSTWASVINTGNSTRRIQVFRFLPTSTITGENVQLGTFGGGSTGFMFNIWEITGIDISGSNGANAIAQSTASSGSGANPSITMSAFSSAANAGMALFYNDANPFNGTAESGWSEIDDGGYSTPTTGAYTMNRLLTIDNTPTVTASASNWIGVAIEIKSGLRRIIITN